MKIRMAECLRWCERSDESLVITADTIGSKKSNFMERLINRLFYSSHKVKTSIATEILNELNSNFSHYNENEALKLCLTLRNFTKSTQVRTKAEEFLEKYLTPNFAAKDLDLFGEKNHEHIGFIHTRSGEIPVTQPKKRNVQNDNALVTFVRSHLALIDLTPLVKLKLYVKSNTEATQIEGCIRSKSVSVALKTLPEIQVASEHLKQLRQQKLATTIRACANDLLKIEVDKNEPLLRDTVIQCANNGKVYANSDILKEISFFAGFFNATSSFSISTPYNPEDLSHLSPDIRAGTTDQNHYVNLEDYSKEAVEQMISHLRDGTPLSQDIDGDLLMEIFQLADYACIPELKTQAENLMTKDIDAEGIKVLLTYPHTYSESFYKMLAERTDIGSLWPKNDPNANHHAYRVSSYLKSTPALFDFLKLTGFRDYTFLRTNCNKVTRKAIEKIIREIIQYGPNIEHLDLDDASLSRADIQNLSSLKHLHTLVVCNENKSDPSIKGLQMALLNRNIERLQKARLDNKPYIDLEKLYAICMNAFNAAGEDCKIDSPILEFALENEFDYTTYLQYEMNSFQKLVRLLEEDAVTKESYLACHELFTKFSNVEKREALGLIVDPLVARALVEGMAYEDFQTARQEDIAAASRATVDLTQSNPSLGTLLKAEHVQVPLNHLSDLLDRFKMHKERLIKTEAAHEVQTAQLKEWNEQLEVLNSDLEQLKTRPKGKKVEAAIKAKKNDILKLRLNIKNAMSVDSSLPKNPSLKYLSVVLGAEEHTVDSATIQTIKEIEAICGHSVKIRWSSAENASLTLDKTNVFVPNIKELKVVGLQNLNRILSSYPDIEFLDLSDYMGEINADLICEKCPHIKCIRKKESLIEYPEYVTQKDSFENIDRSTANSFFAQLMGKTLSKDLQPDSSVTIAGKTYPYHAAVLANCSTRFRTTLTSEMEDLKSFDQVLEYAYTGQVTISGVGQALQLMDAAETLQIPGLMRLAQTYVLSSIDSSNWAEYAPVGNHAKLTIRLFCEANPKLNGAKAILDQPFPIAPMIPEVTPLSINSNEFSDYSIQVQGREFFLHKAILASRNAYFHNYFSGGLSKHESSIERRDVNAYAQSVVLEHIYGKSHSFEGVEDARNILWLAEHDQVIPLRKAAFEHIASRLMPTAQTIDSAHTTAANREVMSKFKQYFEFCAKYSESEAYAKGMNELKHFFEHLKKSRQYTYVIQDLRSLADADVPFPGKREFIVSIDEHLARLYT
jgi:hypothetical protein